MQDCSLITFKNFCFALEYLSGLSCDSFLLTASRKEPGFVRPEAYANEESPLCIWIPLLREAGILPPRITGCWVGIAEVGGGGNSMSWRAGDYPREVGQQLGLRGPQGSRWEQWQASHACLRAASQMAWLSALGARRQAAPDEVGSEERRLPHVFLRKVC